MFFPLRARPARPRPARARRSRHALGLACLLTAGLVACERQDASPPTLAAPPSPPAAATPTPDGTSAEPDRHDVPAVNARAEGQLGPGRGTVLIDIQPPDGAKLNREAPLSARATGGTGLAFPERFRGPLGEHELPLRLPVAVQDGATGPAEVELSYYWCGEAEETACQRETARLSLALDLTGDGAGGEAYLQHRAQPR
jgi:hypothetical protein